MEARKANKKLVYEMLAVWVKTVVPGTENSMLKKGLGNSSKRTWGLSGW